MTKPNIIVYLSDDHGTEYLGCYGNTHIKTPHLDRIAEHGMRFTQAFTPTPTCVPSRSTLYTGLYPARHGAMGNHTECHATLDTLPKLLREQGYRVAIAGKTHVKPASLFDFEYIGGFLPKQEEHRRKYRAEGLDTDPVEKFLSTHQQENPNQPLCLILGDSNPHVTWEPNKIYDPNTLPLPPYIADTPIARKALANYYQDITTMDTRIGEIDKMLETHGYSDNTLFIYTTDHGSEWPHCKWTLYDTGIQLPFIARWQGVVPKGSVSDAIISHIDFLPTLIDIAGGEPSEDLDGKSYKEVLCGQHATFRDKIYGTHTRDGNMNVFPQRCVRNNQYKYILNLMPENTWTTHFTQVEGIPESHAEVWNSWVEKAKHDPNTAKLVYLTQHHPVEELYDITADPYEFDNIAYDPTLQPILEQMRADVQKWMQTRGDKGEIEYDE